MKKNFSARYMYTFLILLSLGLALTDFPSGVDLAQAQLATPDYFGVPNWANSPLPQINGSGAVVPGTGIRKFVDTLPGLCALGMVNNLGQCIPLATVDTGTYPSFQGPAADFYRIGLQEYTLKMHSDLPPTNLRGYVQINTSGIPVYDPATPGKQQYLGPLILATRNKPVRILFNNKITTNLNIPVDTTYMGAGMVNDGVNSMMASQKRAIIHLHGGNTPWISDGTPHQWITPASGDGQPIAKGFAKGFSFMNVPDMLPLVLDNLTDGFGTHYWTNQQSGRLMFYHDHAYGITRLNVYVGEAAGYLLVDQAQENALAAATVPGTIGTTPDLAHIIPLVIQDKTFVPDPAQLAATDPTWSTPLYGGKGNLWFPHVYMPNQNPYDITGANPFGRWDYGPWFWPIQPVTVPPVPCTSIAYPGQQLLCPGTPNPSGTPEAFMDTPIVNGTAYPKLVVDPRAYRFHILSAGNDRALNLGLYVAEPLSVSVTTGGSGYTSPPIVTITGGGGNYTSATATVVGGVVTGITVTGATGYTSVPTISITGGGGTGAAAIASVNTEVKMVPAIPANVRALTPSGSVGSLTVTKGGSFYSSPPTVTITGGGGTGATGTATLGKAIGSIQVTNQGTGYASAPAVTFTGGGGSGATATAYVLSGRVFLVSMTNGGTGYTSAPTVGFTGGGGTGATATATLSTFGGSVSSLTLTNPGTGYTSPPTVTITGGGGTGATATATLSAGGMPDCTTSNQMTGGGLVLAQDINGTSINTPTGLPIGCWPTYDSTFFGPLSWPTDSRDGGVPDPTTAGPPIIQIGTEGGLLPKVSVIPSTPISYDYNRRSITVLNVLNHGLYLGPAERADVIIDFSAFAGKTLILYNDAPAPVPASDPRVDYYTNNLDYTSLGGAPPTLAGYGPNTRTIMQIVVNNINPNTSFNLATLRAALPAIFASTQDPIIVPETDYPPANGGAATNTYARIQDTSVSLFIGGPVGGLALQSGGSGYTSTPTVNITGGGGSGATATATLSPTGSVISVQVTSGGTGYTSAPTIGFTGGGGTGAAATATLVGQPVANIALTNGGSGYTSTPTVNITGGGGTGATATATLAASGPIGNLTVTNRGSFYSSPPTVTITGGGGTGATATATIGKAISSITITNQGTGYTSAPTVTFTGGGGSGATATAYVLSGRVFFVTMTNGGTGYTSAPTVTFTGGGGTGATATATLSAYGSVVSLTLTNGGSGYISSPTVIITGGGGIGATATATIIKPVASIALTNGGSGYISPPTVNITGGGGTGATATATLLGPVGVGSITVTNGGSGYTSPPTVTITGGGGSGATATSTIGMSVASLTLTSGGTGYTSQPTVTFTGGGGSGAFAIATGAMTPLLPKAIQELFTLDYGRMNALLGVEMPFSTALIQTTIPYGFVDPPTEVFKDGDTQLWKITHNGVDTHFIHFHLFTVQVINRVGWDGAIKPPDPNELGFKDTVRMNPLEDIIVALKAMKQNLPWDLPNSIRPMDVTMPLGTTNATGGTFLNVDPTNQPASVTNSLINYGWEYVWHCHILGHEENDMMRAMAMSVAPTAPSGLAATPLTGPVRVRLDWTDNSINETNFTIQRSTNGGTTWVNIARVPSTTQTGTGSTVTYTDFAVTGGTTYNYRVIANNVVGYTQTYAPPAIGYPTPSADSGPSNSVSITP